MHTSLNTRSRVRRGLAAAAVAASLTLVAACGENADTDAASASADGSTEADSVRIDDSWVKAAEGGMTASFGTITNTGDDAITLVSVASPASEMIELHETVTDSSGASAMQEKDGGFVIEPGESHLLEPGGDHIMFMGVASALTPGDEVPLTLTFSDGSTLDLTSVVKEFDGAEEEYSVGREGDDMGDDMDMGDDHSGMDHGDQ